MFSIYTAAAARRTATLLAPRTSTFFTPAVRPTQLLRTPTTSTTLRHFTRTRRLDALPPARKPKKPSSSNTTPEKADGQPRLIERLRAAGQLSSATAPPVMTPTQRLLSPFLFTLVATAGALYYGYTYTSPTPSTRLFPTVPQSFATVASLIALNTAVFVAWRIPLPISWRLLNRYFISVPAYPYAASMLGNVFSHQSFSHLSLNMIALYIFGTSVCEQLGPGWFLALYLSGGAVSSFGSLAYNVLRSRFTVSSLGASGAISGLVGAYAVLNPDAELSLIFLPFLAMKAKTFVGLLAGVEVLGIVRGWQVLDHMAHLGGLCWGTGFMVWLEKEMEKRREALRRIYGR